MDNENQIQSSNSSNTPISTCESGLIEKQTFDVANLLVTPEVVALVSPGGSKLWIPECSVDLKPKLDLTFKNLSEALKFYEKYATATGFNVRISQRRIKNAVIVTQNYVCNKSGYKENTSTSTRRADGTRKRKRMVVRVGCNARLIVKRCEDGSYKVTEFIEEHIHKPFSPGFLLFQKGGRKLNILHKKMIVDNAKLNIGPIKTFRQVSQYSGGYENVGASKEDFKNFQRDLKEYINDSDAQMFINNFKSKQLLWPAFFFEYAVDEEGHLCKAFWADPLCRKNYALYGDMISFDTTYTTNRYNMIFGPFTGVDNHKRCITFGSCLIAKETVASFEWVFKTFLKCMGNNEPRCMITDQDPAMLIAIDNVFQKTQHRFCTWHITKKFPEKLGKAFPNSTEFLTKINACIWDVHLEPKEFEAKWAEVISEFDLKSHVWFTQMFLMREMWIPAFFRELPLGGLMRTTSRSESENSFYCRFINAFVTLVEFNMRYETAIDSQRHEQAKLDNDCKNAKPGFRTPLKIEKYGAEQYTTMVFYEFRDEVYIGHNLCGLVDLDKVDGFHIYTINQQGVDRKFKVAYNSVNNETACSCKLFNRHGFPCRHMIWVWKNKMLDVIPKQYVLNRWTIYAAQKPIFDMEGNVLEQCATQIVMKRTLNELWSEIHLSVSLAEGNPDILCDFVANMKELRQNLESKISGEKNMSHTSKDQDIELLIGVPKPTEIEVKEPRVSKNKGTGVHVTTKRLRSNRDIVVEKLQRPLRNCKGCQQMVNHDIRNCKIHLERLRLREEKQRLEEEKQKLEEEQRNNCSSREDSIS